MKILFLENILKPNTVDEAFNNDITVMNIEIYEKITGIRDLVNLLEEADNDIENGNYLTEEEMDKKIDLL